MITDKERRFVKAVEFFKQWTLASEEERHAVGRDAYEWIKEASFELADEIKSRTINYDEKEMTNKATEDEYLKPIKPLLEHFQVFGSPEYTFPRVFVVRERERIYGADSDYSFDGSVWVSHDGEMEFETEYQLGQYLESDDNLEEDEDGGERPMLSEEDFTEVFYHDVNMIKKIFFTRQAAEEYFFAQSRDRQANLFVDEEAADNFGHEILAICEMLNQLKELQQ